MVFLKKTATLLLICCAVLAAKAQTTKEIIAAFEQSYIYESNSQHTKAAQSLEKVYSAQSYEINLRLGWLYYVASQYEKSLKYYTIAKNILPYSEEAKMGIVLPLSKLNKWHDIETIYKDILNINSKNTTVLYRMGLLHYNRKEYSKAYEYFKSLTDLYPFDYDALLMYAWSNLQLGKMKEAEILFNKTLMNRPNDSSALEGLRYIK